jgi:alkylated DNA repair dioxygenase AlkB
MKQTKLSTLFSIQPTKFNGQGKNKNNNNNNQSFDYEDYKSHKQEQKNYPPGLKIFYNFLSLKEEEMLLKILNGDLPNDIFKTDTAEDTNKNKTTTTIIQTINNKEAENHDQKEQENECCYMNLNDNQNQSEITMIPNNLPKLFYSPPSSITSTLNNDNEFILPWSTVLQRRTCQYGYQYNYSNKYTPPTPTTPLPKWLKEMVLIKILNVFHNNDINFGSNLNLIQCIINEYLPNQGISPHTDHERFFGDVICSLSLGSDTVMDFEKSSNDSNNNASNSNNDVVVRPIYLPRRSLVILQGESRYKWKHSIPKRQRDINCNSQTITNFNDVLRFNESDTIRIDNNKKSFINVRSTRYSFTFRTIKK